MKDGKKRTSRTSAFIGAASFFLLVSAIVTVALVVYGYVAGSSGDDRTVISVTMLLVILLVSVLCTLIDYVRRKFTVDKPIRDILDATDRIACGDFSVRLQPRHAYRRYDGFDFIMENINKMAKELSQSEILKSDFISNVSHEIKTPVAIIQNYSQLLSQSNLTEQQRLEYADALQSAAKRLNSLVTNVLKLNKLESQGIAGEFEPVRLDESISQAVLSYVDVIDEKQIELNCSLGEVTAVTSAANLEIVWNNLISNAVKFTPVGGNISVSLSVEHGQAVVRVSDTGCGISPEAGKRIFDKFYQGDTSHSGEGNGLGLALVKKVIDVLGGEISVESEVDVGTTFTVKLKGEIIERQ